MILKTKTDKGIKRKENQDNYWSALLSVDDIESGIICLCDGMGGLNNGGLASRMVVESVKEYIKTSVDFTGLIDVIRHINKTIYELGKSENQSMGTTCTILFCSSGKYEILHVGDSRCYKTNSEGIFELVTTDHSALKKYNITKEDNYDLWKKFKNSLTRCIGVKPDVTIDYLEGNYTEGDKFMLCSDGLWHFLDEKVFRNESILDFDLLIQQCIDNGETDNITIGVLEV